MQQPHTLRNHLMLLAAAAAVLIITLAIYASRGNNYAPETPTVASTRPPITNAYLLTDVMPPSVYRYTVARISDYLLLNSFSAASMDVNSGVTSETGTYDFTVALEPQNQALVLDVNVSNNSGFISTSVTINNQLQAPYIPGSTSLTSNTASYSGFDALVDKGLAAIQANELGQAFVQFAPDASSFAINQSSIATYLPLANQNNSDVTYKFSVKVDGKTYDATVTAIGLYQTRLLIVDPQTHKQVYDSGTLDQGA